MKLRGLTFISFILLLLAQMSYTQPVAVPLTGNPALQSNSTEAQFSETLITKVYLPIQANTNWCPPEDFLPLGIDSIWVADCGPSAIDITVSDSCLTLSTATITDFYTDTLCLIALTKEEEIPFQIDVRVSPPHSLPFIDDFSSTAPYPDEVKWQDRDVFINNTFGKDPPSLGVATFDGVDETGNPYGTGYGKSDFLTSNFIDLTGQFNAHIRFWYQARGLGFETYPREIDSLILEFKTETGIWNTVWSVPGPGREDTPEFQSVSLPITPEYLSDKFQFRFVNYSDNNGMLSTWHLDYIMVTSEDTEIQGVQDVAFTQPAQSVLTPYRAMPYAHFKGNEEKYIRSSIDINLFNHFNSIQLANPSRLKIIAEKGNDRTQLLSETLLEVPPTVEVNQRNLDPGRHYFTNEIKLRNSDLIPQLKDLPYDAADEDIRLITEMTFDNSGEPTELNSNNYTQFVAELGDHFAYDDGTAELGIFIPFGTNFPSVVQKFTLEKEDTLKAVRFHFPLIRPNITEQRYNIVIYQGELGPDNAPIYIEPHDRAVFPSTHQDSLGGFATFALKNEDGEHEGIVVPKGDIYIGWQQLSANTNFGIYVGYDVNSPDVSENGNILYSNDATSWHEYDAVSGALMIRPVFGREQPISTSVKYPDIDELTIYPNPSTDYITIRGENLQASEHHVNIFALSGQKIYSDIYQEKIDVSSFPSGKYLVRIVDEKQRISHVGSFIHMK